VRALAKTIERHHDAAADAMTALIRVDLDRVIGRVDRRVFGGFIEHLGRCIYGGIFDEGSSLADELGFRQDVLSALKALRMPVLRWPGGNFVSGYHWTDGIGPVDERPRKLELAWQSEESNRFGTDEFIAYCRALETEPYICVNMGTGSLDEAQAWVEYCNGNSNTYWANRRRANGHAEPYRVRYWGLGNEMYGEWQIGGMRADEYVAAARRFAKVMKLTDPTIELVSCGLSGSTDWDRTVIDGLADLVRYHSIHIYTGSSDYLQNVLHPHAADHALRVCEAFIERIRHSRGIQHRIGIAYDEWNVWYRTRDAAGRTGGLEERYDLSDALAVACFLNIFIRHCRSVAMANLAQMVNVIAPVFTSRQGLFLQTIYHPMRLYSEHMQELALDPLVDSPLLPLESGPVADLGPFQTLDAVATRDADRQVLALAVVNRDPHRSIETRLDFVGTPRPRTGTVYEVNGASPIDVNSFEQPDRVAVSERDWSGGDTLQVPPHSISVLRLPL
jgi:alpha-N-arabinofuranosidase